MRQLILLLFASICTALIQPLSGDQQGQAPVFESPKSRAWADSVLNTMSIEQQLGQLFMVAAYSNKGPDHVAEIQQLIQEQHIGGLIFFQGGPLRQAKLTNKYQALSKVPLMIAMDAEWGLGMRLDSTFNFPWAMSLGAIQNPSLIYEMGSAIAKHCKRLGVQINFAPVVDVNSNPLNPIINRRSFGEQTDVVTRQGLAYMKGMQDQQVLACAKHFPGHGDTDADSHHALPILQHDMQRLKEVELKPFEAMIQQGLGSMMVAHLFIPQLDSTPNLATTLSPVVVDQLLKQQMKFQGLVFTDALNMKGVSKYFEPGQVDLMAFKAGNDVLLFAEDVPRAVAMFKEALSTGEIHPKQVETRVRKILMAKHWMGLSETPRVEEEHLFEDLNAVGNEVLFRQLTEASLTVAKNDKKILPFNQLHKQSFAVIGIGGGDHLAFQERLKHYANVKVIEMPSYWGPNAKMAIEDQLQGVNHLIVGLHKDDPSPWKSYKMSREEKDQVSWLLEQRASTLCVFTNPYALLDFDAGRKAQALVLAYQNNAVAQDFTAQMLFGAKAARGKAPVSALPLVKAGQGYFYEAMGNLQYGIPEEEGIRSEAWDSIAVIMEQAIANQATPGGQILVAKKGKVVYHKSFGYHTYNKLRPVAWDHVYDLASITKIGATVPLLMQLEGLGFFDMDQSLGKYLNGLPEDKAQLNIRKILAHQSGLPAWIPFYKHLLDEGGQRKPQWFNHYSNEKYSERVAENLFARSDLRDSIYYIIDTTAIQPDQGYKYSDLGYYYLQRVIEKRTGKGLQQLVKERFADPMGAWSYGYKPLENFYVGNVVPSEQDYYFRYQLLQGDVHDPGAALLNGVGGHAGLFSNANDLAKMMQMLLQNGYYGGKQFLESEVVKSYTAYQDDDTNNRRGAGFDKPMRCCGGGGSCCSYASSSSFGHSGFTGTLTWVDPQEDLVYVFLSNRVYPDALNYKLVRDNVRTEIQRVIYQALDCCSLEINQNSNQHKS